ncbi:MAG: sensor histidine kinase [Bacteroidales bacterium]
MMGKQLNILLFSLLMLPGYLSASDPVAEKGVMDLRYREDMEAILLSGEWEFYWKKLIQPGEPANKYSPDTYGKVPAYWTRYKHEVTGISHFGYATYRLTILFPENFRDSLSLKIPIFDSSYGLFLNGKYITGNGLTGTTRETTTPAYFPDIHTFLQQEDTLEIMIHVSNFHHRRGGFWKQMQLGKYEIIRKQHERYKVINYSLAGILIFTFLSFLTFYFLERSNLSFLFFSLSTLGFLIRLIQTGLYPGNYFYDQAWIWSVRLEYLGTFFAFVFGVHYLNHIYPSKPIKKLSKINSVLFLILSGIVIFTQPYIFGYSIYILYLFAGIFLFYFIYRSFNGLLRRKILDSAFFISVILLIMAMVNDILVSESYSPANYEYLLPLFFLLFVVVQILTLIIQWINNYKEKIVMHHELQYINQNLENIIDSRTKELKTSNEELESALELKSKMYSVIAHDLKSPVATLAQYAEYLAGKFGKQDDLKILHELQRLAYTSVDLIDNMLHWGLKQGKNILYQPEVVNILDVIHDIRDLIQYSIEYKNISLEISVDKALTAYCDNSLLNISLRNLLTNAVKFTQENGIVSIMAEKRDGEVIISVKDTGIGIDEKKVEMILNGNVESTRGTSGERGTGLGMIVVKDLININRGMLHINSKPGRGTLITFTLPGEP